MENHMNQDTLRQSLAEEQNTIYDALYELGQHRIQLNLENARTDENGLYPEEAKIRERIASTRYLNEQLNHARRDHGMRTR